MRYKIARKAKLKRLCSFHPQSWPKKKIIVAFEGEDWLHHCSSDNLELIPHPDTARLDWLAKNDCSLTERLCDEDGDRLDTPFAVIQKQQEHFEVLAAACDIREAIDEAMRQEAV